MKNMKPCTQKQLSYANILLERHDRAGTLEDVIIEINPDQGENEDFMVWLARQPTVRAAEVIATLRSTLPPGVF